MKHLRMAFVKLAVLLAACGGDGAAPTVEMQPAPEPPPPPAAPAPAEVAEAPDEPPAAEEEADAPDPFAAPFPEEPCPDPVVHLAHAEEPDLPATLTRAVALRREDGRSLLVALASYPLTQDDRGRFTAPDAGQARFEFEALRPRRRPLEPGVLSRPNGRRARFGFWTLARIVTAGPYLTFGEREGVRIELTRADEEMVCGRLDLSDGRGRVRGAFRARVVGPLPD